MVKGWTSFFWFHHLLKTKCTCILKICRINKCPVIVCFAFRKTLLLDTIKLGWELFHRCLAALEGYVYTQLQSPQKVNAFAKRKPLNSVAISGQGWRQCTTLTTFPYPYWVQVLLVSAFVQKALLSVVNFKFLGCFFFNASLD